MAMRIPKPILFLAILALASGPVAAEEIVPAREYAKCMELAQSNPEQGFEMAVSWRGLGGGDAARHCEAVSLFGLGHYDEAGRRLEELAQTLREEPAFRAQLFGQAGQAWLLAGVAQRADHVLSAAIDLAPRDPELRIDRAQALAAQGALFEAIEDLTDALALDPDRVVAYVFRAAAYRQSGRANLARDDVTRALALEPDHPEALLERGILNRLEDDKVAARRDWLAVIEVAPESAAARSARENLQRMDGPPQ
jgi:tetratricopeptide (TPR) repeat protein